MNARAEVFQLHQNSGNSSQVTAQSPHHIAQLVLMRRSIRLGESKALATDLQAMIAGVDEIEIDERGQIVDSSPADDCNPDARQNDLVRGAARASHRPGEPLPESTQSA